MLKNSLMICSCLLLLLAPSLVRAQFGTVNNNDREAVRRELEARLTTERGYRVVVRIDSAETYNLNSGMERGIRGRAQVQDRSRRWDTLWYEAVLEGRRSRVARLEWGDNDWNNRSRNRGDRRDDNRRDDNRRDDTRRDDNRPSSGVLQGGRYEIQLVATSRMLDVANGRQAVQRSANNSRSQEWDIEDAGNGYYYIRSAESGEVLTRQGENNGANVWLTRQRPNDDAQLWEIRSGPDNGYYFLTRSGRSLDSPSSARQEGGRMQIYSRNGEANQRFLLRPVDQRGRGDNRGRDRFDNRDRDTLGSGRLTWSGRVDGEIEIEIRGSSVRERHINGQPPAGVRTNSGWSLPRRDVSISVNKLRGRGRVEVLEQPSARNGYVALIRVSDSQGGADDYELEISWN
jgi:hypothetical protein